MISIKQKHITLLLSAVLWLIMATCTIIAQSTGANKPNTNISDVLKYPRTENSMPGKFPGKVVQAINENSVIENEISYDAAYDMLAQGMLSLTSASTLKEAWRMFVNEKDRIGLKVNPIGGTSLSTSKELVRAIINQLEEAGIPKHNIIIWDRFEEHLINAGFTQEKFPGIKIVGFEWLVPKDNIEQNSNYEFMIDKDWSLWADVDGKYHAKKNPFKKGEEKYSYFTKIITQMVDKIINVPILKFQGPTLVTFCLKNLAYGSVTNTPRLHSPDSLHCEAIAGICAFPPLRDKVVLNIGDAIKGSFSYGPGANEQFYFNYHSLLIGTDPVAIDRIAYDIILKKRIDEKIEREDTPSRKNFLNLAQEFKLGVADLNNIQLVKINLK